jgi:hypothetical protein
MPDEVSGIARRAHELGTIESFARHIRDHFNVLLAKFPGVPKRDRGLGLHVVGYEDVEGFKIPELFLVTNFKSLSYDDVADAMGCSRRTNLTITDDSGDDAYLEKHREPEFRHAVREHLASGRVLFFNNGDPELFTIAANGLVTSMKALKNRGALKGDSERWRHLAKAPIEIIGDLQKSYAKKKFRLVGGKIHDLTILPDGRKFSDTGVVRQRWSDR